MRSVSNSAAVREGTRVRLRPCMGGEADAAGSPSFALRAVRPVKAALLTAWYFAAFAAELAAFAVVSTTLHPMVTIGGYLFGAMANAVTHHLGGGWDAWKHFLASCAMPAVAMEGAQTKAFLKDKDVQGPGWIPAAFILIRFFTWAGLCFLDLPHGLLPLGPLGRPMGFPVLQAKFLSPAAACREALVCFTSQTWIRRLHRCTP